MYSEHTINAFHDEIEKIASFWSRLGIPRPTIPRGSPRLAYYPGGKKGDPTSKEIPVKELFNLLKKRAKPSGRAKVVLPEEAVRGSYAYRKRRENLAEMSPKEREDLKTWDKAWKKENREWKLQSGIRRGQKGRRLIENIVEEYRRRPNIEGPDLKYGTDPIGLSGMVIKHMAETFPIERPSSYKYLKDRLQADTAHIRGVTKHREKTYASFPKSVREFLQLDEETIVPPTITGDSDMKQVLSRLKRSQPKKTKPVVSKPIKTTPSIKPSAPQASKDSVKPTIPPKVSNKKPSKDKKEKDWLLPTLAAMGVIAIPSAVALNRAAKKRRKEKTAAVHTKYLSLRG